MANKEIRAVYDNGVMIWPATTTTAVVDPTSRETLDVILGKKEDKPIEITDCIPSRLMSINSAEDAVTLSSEEETQLAPLITGFTTTGTKFTFGTLPAIPTDYTNTYSWEIWGLPGFTAKFLIWIKLHYIDEEVSGETVRSYWLEQGYENVLFSETDPTNQPTFIDVDMADLVADSVTYPGEVWYFLSEEDDPYPESTFIDSEGRNKRIVLRIRPLEDDDYDWGTEFENPESWYFPIAIELSPLEGDYYPQSGVLHAAGTAEILRGIQLYNGILYCALIYTFEEDNNHNYYIAIHKTEMKGKISGMPAYEDTPTYPTEGDTYTTGFGKLNRIVQSHEEVTARALLDLNTRVLALGSGGGSGGGGMTEITYSNLVTLKNGGTLTPGSFYRITDYTCTTSQELTYSAGHVFDIIVLALSESSLSEEAWADRHDGDTYFTSCKLEAWELKYCLDNDTTRFEWANTTNGKGVIYYMKDEWGNECSYDFKNIQFDRYISNGVYDEEDGEDYHVYTFNYWDSTNEVCKDATLALNNVNISDLAPVRNNVIKSFCGDPANIQNKFRLNDVVSLLTDSYENFYNNIFENDCYDITLESAYDNNFGAECKSIVAGYQFRFNVLGVRCLGLTFGDTCAYNQLGNYAYSCTFGNNFLYNNLGINCSSCNFGNYNQYTVFGASCKYITIDSNYANYITIDSGNKYITLTTSQTPTNNSQLRNIRIASGVNNTTTRKTISHETLGDTFQTTYKPANSVEVSV